MSVLLLLALFVRDSAMGAMDFFPDTGKAAIIQSALELRARLRVMSIALRPGEEDCAALALLRMGRGARVTSVYVTNGEKEGLDTDDLYPFDVAATRRVQASKAMAQAGAEAIFLNLPDLDASPSHADARTQWNMDTLELRLRRLLEPTQPALVLLMSDTREGDTSAGSAVVREALLRVCSRLPWKVSQILFEGGGTGKGAPMGGEKHPAFNLTYAGIADTIRASYSSLRFPPARHGQSSATGYKVLYPRGARNVLYRKDVPLAGRIPDSLLALDKQVRDLAGYALRPRITGKELVSRILPVLQRVDRAVTRFAATKPRELRIVLDWKDTLERLRTAALGVSVKHSLEYAVLCERQLVRLTLDNIRANMKLGAMEIVVHDVGRGWILNESLKSRIPVKAGDTLRLITPAKVEYDFPLSLNTQLRPAVGQLLTLTLVHAGARKEETFVYQMSQRIFFAPRFAAEVLTPIVRGYTGEQVITRLTNHSRDGVTDILKVDDTLATSTSARVALSWKEAARIDTLSLTWRGSIADGTSLVHITYGGVPVAQFLARTFECTADTARRIGVISAWKSGALLEALRRIGLSRIRNLSGDAVDSHALDSMDVVVVDRRALSLRGLASSERAALHDFTQRGGHLVVLPQEPEAWQTSSLWTPVQLDASRGLPPDARLSVDTTDVFLSQPNLISRADFEGWLDRMSYNTVTLRAEGADVRVPVRTSDGMPLLVTAPAGRGRVTYVDLALGPQWMNVAPGALRLLANIVSE